MRGLGWKLYTALAGKPDYTWASCPFFADCRYTNQHFGMVPDAQIINDAETSMIVGDNWIGSVINAIEHGPDWYQPRSSSPGTTAAASTTTFHRRKDWVSAYP